MTETATKPTRWGASVFDRSFTAHLLTESKSRFVSACGLRITKWEVAEPSPEFDFCPKCWAVHTANRAAEARP